MSDINDLWDNEIGDFTMVDQGGVLNIGDFTMVDFQTCSDHSNSTALSHDEIIDLSHELGKIDSSPGSSRLGLRLRKSPSFVSMLERCLSRSNNEGSTSRSSTDNNLGSSSHEKLKASNFPALYLQIGDWQRTSRNEGDLVAKLYYAKRKMVWELLDGALKSKIEMQWNDIVGIKIFIGENAMGVLEIELDKPPLYFKETNPQPRKHTLWQPTSDFTNGQAPTWRRHCVRFAPGILDKHIEKLLQYDERLLELSHTPFPSQLSPYFESNINISSSLVPSNINSLRNSYQYHQSHDDPQHNIAAAAGIYIAGGHHQYHHDLNQIQNHWAFGQEYYSDHHEIMNTILPESLDVNTMNINHNNNSQMIMSSSTNHHHHHHHYQQYTNGGRDYHDHQQAHHAHGMQIYNGITNNNNNNNNNNSIDHHHANWLLVPAVPPPQDHESIPPPFRQLPPGPNFGSSKN
ncbi:hypothetical protein ACJIZ3_000937 [Penstemon smallii]|uniref:TRF2/HOY1 PH-like domain-containing protein n=1 Tax=Penstemon smallii TaxID=265156 RepID=A0ABD3U248_9LAMI